MKFPYLMKILKHGQADIKLSPIGRKTITETKEESKKLIDCIKKLLPTYNKAKMRAKAENIKTKDYNFFDEIFCHLIKVDSYEVVGDTKRYYNSSQLVKIYKEKIKDAFNENKIILKAISNR